MQVIVKFTLPVTVEMSDMEYIDRSTSKTFYQDMIDLAVQNIHNSDLSNLTVEAVQTKFNRNESLRDECHRHPNHEESLYRLKNKQSSIYSHINEE